MRAGIIACRAKGRRPPGAAFSPLRKEAMSKRHACILLCAGVVCWMAASARSLQPKNIIVCIGDGMGFEHVKAAGIYVYGYDYGAPGRVFGFESFPHRGEVTTVAPDGMPDSASAGTAIATGVKVYDSVVSVAIPGDGRNLETLLEYYKARGRSTGLVTTTYMTHATPACFGAHTRHRDNLAEIAAGYLNYSRPNILFGGGGNAMSPASAAAAGYAVVTDRAGLKALSTDLAVMVSGQFGLTHLPYEYDGDYSTLPHLHEMAATALDILDNDPDGFFLMIEGGRIDSAAHEQNLNRCIRETIEFADTVQEVIDWAAGRGDTLIIVTADHETGGLQVLANNGAGELPAVFWASADHTLTNVPIYASGINSERIGGVMDNTEIFGVATYSRRWPGDFDDDGDVDVADFGRFQACFNGPNRPLPESGCESADLDTDGDADLADFGTFQACFNGPNRPPGCESR
jgi:alkaline phosphatase